MTPNKLNYLAGYVDGDGCFFARTYIQKHKNIMVFEFSLLIASVCKQIIEYFNEEFGGYISYRPDARSDRKDIYVWTIKARSSVPIMEVIHDLLIMKQKNCFLCLSLARSIISSKAGKGRKVDKTTIDHRFAIINQLKKEIYMNDFVNEEVFLNLKQLKKSIDPSEANFAYFAGLIDAEGCLRICHHQPKRKGRKKSFIAVLEIGNTKKSIFPWLIERFGGSITYRAPSSRNHNPMIIWSLRAASFAQVLPKILPFLKVKKERAEKIMEFNSLLLEMGGNRKSIEFKQKCEDILLKKEKIVEEIHILNAKGKH